MEAVLLILAEGVLIYWAAGVLLPASKPKGRSFYASSPHRRDARLLEAYADALAREPRSLPQADGE